MHLLWHLQQVFTCMAQKQRNACAKIAITFFRDIVEILFPLLAKTFMLLKAKKKVDAANIEHWGSLQMICTTYCPLCIFIVFLLII